MSGRSQTGQKNSGICVAMKAQAKHLQQSLCRLPDHSWSRRVHIVMEPVAATGSVGTGMLLGALREVRWFVLVSILWEVLFRL